MRKFFLLSKILFKNSFSIKSKKQLLPYLVLAICFLPTIISSVALLSYGYELVTPAGMQSTILTMGLFAANILTFIFAIFFVPSLLYFSKDNEGLLYLPLTPIQVGLAKLTLVLPTSYIAYLMLAGPTVGVYLYQFTPSLATSVLLICFSLLMPLGAIALAGVISTLFMRLVPFFKNKDLMNNIMMFLILAVALGINYFFSSNIFMEEGKILDLLLNDLPRYNQMLTLILPYVSILSEGALALNFVTIILGLLILVGFVGVLVVFLNLFLLDTMTSVNVSHSKKRRLTSKQLSSSSGKSSSFIALVKKEVKTLLRTPIFFQNCVLINYLFPILLVFPLFLEGGSIEAIQSMAAVYLQDASVFFFLNIGFVLGFFVSNTNMISATGFSRMGEKFYLVRMLPVAYETQVHALIWTGIFYGATSFILIFPLLYFFFAPSILQMALVFIGSVIALVIGNYIGFVIDLIHPYLTWTNEVVSVKQNLNSLAMLFLSMIGSVLLGVLIFMNPLESQMVNCVLIYGITILVSIVLYVVFYRNITKYIEQIAV